MGSGGLAPRGLQGNVAGVLYARIGTYAVMCQLEKKDSAWEAKYANTYRPHYATNIKNLVD